MSDRIEDINPAALARKKRFLEAKEEAGGAVQLMLKNKNKTSRVYFTKNGDIATLTSDPNFTPDPDWLTYDFSQEQLLILKNNDIRNYEIVPDEKDDSVYFIRVKPIETKLIEAQADFLYEIPAGTQRGWNIKVELSPTTMKVIASKHTLKKYENIYPISATVGGQRLLRFYITAPNDPHTLFNYQIVSLADLITDTAVEIKMPYDFTSYGLYTNKLFDKYVRI